MYTWSEMSIFKKVVSVLSLVCMLAWFVLVILEVFAIWECMGLRHMLFGIWCLGVGVSQKNKTMKILWFILAAGRVILSMLNIF